MRLPVPAALIANLTSVDLAYQVSGPAKGILAGTGIPTTDTWTFTAAGAPWVDQQWGAQVILSGGVIYRLGGWTGLVVLRAALIGVIFGCLFLIARRRGLGERRAAILTLAAFTVAAVALDFGPNCSGWHSSPWSSCWSPTDGDGPSRLWVVPVLVCVWANVHGSFFLGPVVLGLAWLEDLHDQPSRGPADAGRRARQHGGGLRHPLRAACLGVCRRTFREPEVTQRITEWQPTTLRDIPGMLFFGPPLGSRC